MDSNVVGEFLILIDPTGLPDWVLYSVPLSILSFAVAFTRIWKTIREEHETGPLWDHLRNRGIGAELVRKMLASVRREHPQVRFLLLESHRPGSDDPSHDAAINARRIQLYRRLGAWHARGIDYGLPAADDPSRLLHYEILFFSLRGPPDREQIRETIAGMMRSNFSDDDDRVRPMLGSLDKLQWLPPP